MLKKEFDHLIVLNALTEIPFSVGKNLLTDFLQGIKSNESIIRNDLEFKKNFGALVYTREEINNLIDWMISKNLIETTTFKGQHYGRVLEITSKGFQELRNPIINKNFLTNENQPINISFLNIKDLKTQITDSDRKNFEAFGDFLSIFNDEQKKAVINNNNKILCIAGAGSGKTTVLTKRIEFLAKYKSVDPSKVLAITFTRKARNEMIKRLSALQGLENVQIETFNSFCEKILKRYNNLVYEKPTRVIDYRDKMAMISGALSKLDTNISGALNTYFKPSQIISKTPEQLANIFMNDCFFIRDYFKFKNVQVAEDLFEANDSDKAVLNLVVGVCRHIDEYMQNHGLRDFADQLIDAINLFKSHKETIPKFEHILIDEYQDINATQIELIDILNSENLFCVGDPRQSIYGWRGSDIKYILTFNEKYPNCEILALTKNYRSTTHVVSLINKSINHMNLPDLESTKEGQKELKLLKFDSEDSEFNFIIQKILETKTQRNEIFILSRTNRQLNDLSQLMKLRGIKHVVRSDELRKTVEAGIEDVTLATIHAIKGLEAEEVFVIGCNNSNFPCKGGEHPIIELLKMNDYDKDEEEKRLLYVAMSRTKKSLYLTYTGRKQTDFITNEMINLLQGRTVNLLTEKIPKQNNEQIANYKTNPTKSNEVFNRLKSWRSEVSRAQSIPAFIVFNDRTLIDLAQKMPSTKEELENVYGIGPTKIMKYGEEILDIINSK